MIKCEKCGEMIDGRTDDNYNVSHTEIKCPDCGHWQDPEPAQPDKIAII